MPGELTGDQRGKSFDSPAPDIGAFQSQGFTLTVVGNGTPQSATINTAFTQPLSVKVAANDLQAPVAGGVITFASPSKGASAVLSSETATIGSNGVASVTATANSSAGTYTIIASTHGGAAAVDFKLTNSQAKSRVVLKLEKKNKRSLGLTARIAPLTLGEGVPTGTVIFELLQKNKKPKILKTLSLSGGITTLAVKPASVVRKTIKILYSGDQDFLSSTLTTVIA